MRFTIKCARCKCWITATYKTRKPYDFIKFKQYRGQFRPLCVDENKCIERERNKIKPFLLMIFD